MMNNAHLTIEEMLTALKSQAVYGRTHLHIAKGLMVAKLVTENLAPTFYTLTLDAHLQAAQMYAAKLYDKKSKPVTIKSLVEKANVSEASFSCATAQEVRNAVKIAHIMIADLGPKLEAVMIRRNEYLAHLDPRTVWNLGSLYERSHLTINDLDDILLETTNILNLFSQILDRSLSIPMLSGSDDYGVVLKLATEAVNSASK